MDKNQSYGDITDVLRTQFKEKVSMMQFQCSHCRKEVPRHVDGSIGQCDCALSKTDVIQSLTTPFPTQNRAYAKTDLKDYSTKLPMASMQWKAFTGDRGVAGIFKFAQKKYGNVDSWRNRTPESLERYESAMLRHYSKWKNGEAIDPESGLNHFAAIAWNALSVLEFIIEDEANEKKK